MNAVIGYGGRSAKSIPIQSHVILLEIFMEQLLLLTALLILLSVLLRA
tara:strand:+ start:275 stop:418 length:144 start_codon:yes stop_codon:yes gene_type:complete